MTSFFLSGVVPEPSRQVAKAGESGALGVATTMLPPGSSGSGLSSTVPSPLLLRSPVPPPDGQVCPVSMATAPHALAALAPSAVWSL